MATTSDAERLAAATLAGLTHSNNTDTPLSKEMQPNMKEGGGADAGGVRSPGTGCTGILAQSTVDGPDSDGATTNKKKRSRKRHVEEIFQFLVEPTVVQVIKKPRTVMNHSYRDFSQVPAELKDGVPITDIGLMSFPQKVHHILSQDEFRGCVSWMPHGRAFKTHLPKVFEQTVCKKYFGHQRYSSFLRQLANYGFKHITQGKDRNCYYHECMLRDRPHLTKYMPQPKDARRLIPDPENEPDFYEISVQYPLSGHAVLQDSKEPDEPMMLPPTAKRARTDASVLSVPSAAAAVVATSNGPTPHQALPPTFANSGSSFLMEFAKARAISNAAALLAAATAAPDQGMLARSLSANTSAMTAALSAAAAAPQPQPTNTTTTANLTATDVLLARHMATASEPTRVPMTLEEARNVVAMAAAAEARAAASSLVSSAFGGSLFENALRLSQQQQQPRRGPY